VEAGVIYQGPDLDQPDPYCCVPTSASMACDAATGGKKRPAVEALRKATTVAHPYGISYSAIAHATAAVANVPSEARYGLSRSQVVALASSGRPFCISIDCSVTVNTVRRTGSFTGGHTIYGPPRNYSVWPGGETCACNKRTTQRHSEFRMQDPGTYSVGFVQWSAELLFRAAESRTGGNGINVLVFPDTTEVYRKVVEAHWVREKPTTESKRLRRVEVGDRPRHVDKFVTGEAWFRADGGRSTAWAELAGGGYSRGDHLGVANVARP
jgi:hypothetical protein